MIRRLLNFRTVGPLIVLSGLLLVFVNLNSITDWWKLRQFSPTSQITELATQTSMTEEAQKRFYINHPQLIADKTIFGKDCQIESIVLGCYHSGQNGITIFDVQDERLYGVEQVTAAHEVLHAAYERLSDAEKTAVNTELLSYFNNSLNDARIKETIEIYRQKDPSTLSDEMHSIFGTEVAELPPKLEAHYKKYFKDRLKVVNYSNNYESVFIQNQKQLENLTAQIEQLRKDLDSAEGSIKSDQAFLENEGKRLQSLRENEQVEEYNSAVPAYNSRVQNLRLKINSYNAKVQQINSLVEQYNLLAYTRKDLLEAIDPRVENQQLR